MLNISNQTLTKYIKYSALLLLSGILLTASFFTGYIIAERNVYVEAVNKEHGMWVVIDEYGNTNFKWK